MPRIVYVFRRFIEIVVGPVFSVGFNYSSKLYAWRHFNQNNTFELKAWMNDYIPQFDVEMYVTPSLIGYNCFH